MFYANDNFNVDTYTNDRLKEIPFFLSYRQRYENFRMNFHSHEGYELYFLLEGSGNYVCEGCLYPLQGNDLIMVEAHEIHKAAPRTGAVYNRTVINFLPEFLLPGSRMKLLEMFSKSNPPERRHLLLHDREHGFIYRLLERMDEEYTAKEPGYEQVLQIYLNRLLTAIYRLSSDSQSRPALAASPVNTKVEALVQYLSRHYAEDIVLNDLAKTFYIDPYYLCHLFKRTTGESIRQFIHYTRIHHAKQYLLSTDWSIADVANKVGFNSISYFSYIFKRQEGLTPQAYRKKRNPEGRT